MPAGLTDSLNEKALQQCYEAGIFYRRPHAHRYIPVHRSLRWRLCATDNKVIFSICIKQLLTNVLPLVIATLPALALLEQEEELPLYIILFAV